MRNKINCSTYKNSIIIKKEQFEHFRTSVQMSYCDSTYSSKLKYMKTCKITGSDCMTSLFYGYGNDSLETNSSMLLVLQPSWDVLLNGAVPSLHPPQMLLRPSSVRPGTDVAVWSVLRSSDSVIPRSHVQTQITAGEKREAVPFGSSQHVSWINYSMKLHANPWM